MVDYGMDDEAITRRVVTALHAETEFSLKEVKVRTDRGDVSLSGEMATHAQIDRSLAIALMVSGVQRVENRLRAPDPNPGPERVSRRTPGSSATPSARF
jgi:hyperosmotically inducible protein